MKKKLKQKVRSQKRIPGLHRKPVSSAIIAEIERKILMEMHHWNVSRSFVIANALAFTFGIELEDNYKKPQLVRKRA